MALDLLRKWRLYIDPALVSYLRGSIWLEAGDPVTAVLFFEHASELKKDDDNFLARYLDVLYLADPLTAEKRADEILKEYSKYSPIVISRAVGIIRSASVRTASDLERRRIYEYLERILKVTLPKVDQQLDRSIYVILLAQLGFCYELLDNWPAALESYSRGLLVDPDNDTILVSRGMLTYGTNPQAINDLEIAIQTGTSYVWPYFFLAHHYLLSRRFEECRRLCERVLSTNCSTFVKSEASRWMAIAQAELGFPAETVRASFENAMRLDPSNERVKRNLVEYESANKPNVTKDWETRSQGEIQTWGLTEYRFAGAT
jgi:tetratricopeptide (TPR) repeat protein